MQQAPQWENLCPIFIRPCIIHTQLSTWVQNKLFFRQMATLQLPTYRILHRALRPIAIVGELPFGGDVVLHFVYCAVLLRGLVELRRSSTIPFGPIAALFAILQLVNQPPIAIAQDHFKTMRYFPLLPLHTFTIYIPLLASQE